jgi:D-threo-aldose 1-dehydrogenase
MKMLGGTGILCPPIVYGTSYLGNMYKELSKEEKTALIGKWFSGQEGNVIIDSAGLYGAGLALEVLGGGLDELCIDPDNVTISLKLSWYRVPKNNSNILLDPAIWKNLEYDVVQKIGYSEILECWEQGCELLGDKYNPKMVSVHDPDEYLEAAENDSDLRKRKRNILDAYRALFELKEKGEVQAVGIGAKNWKVIYELYNDIEFDWIMLANKFTIFHHPEELIRFTQRLNANDTGIINSGIFNAGFLTGGAYFDYRIADPDKPEDKHLFEWRQNFFSICEKHKIAPGDACIKFASSAPQIDAIALNPGKPDRIENNLQVINAELPARFWEELKYKGVIDAEYPYL